MGIWHILKCSLIGLYLYNSDGQCSVLIDPSSTIDENDGLIFNIFLTNENESC